MTRILYGFSGEGSGHAARSRVMMAHLLARGHAVLGASYDRGYAGLRDEFELVEIEGLSLASVDNRISARRTVAANLAKLGDGVRGLFRLRRACKDFGPEVVITDFEPLTAHFARRHGLPLVTLDNQHRLRYMRYRCPPGLRRDALVTGAVMRAFVPPPDVSLVTTFWYGEVKNERTFLFPPILRPEVLALKPRDEGHVLVYFTHGFDAFIAHLKACRGERFLVYGTGRQGREDNLELRAPSGSGFLQDLAGAKAVIATAGFTLMTEALHLGKPYLALPMKGQFEQELNALLLAEAGYGMNGGAGGLEGVSAFLERLGEFRGRLAGYPRADNAAVQGMLDRLVEDGGALARGFQRARRGGPVPGVGAVG